MSDRPGDDPARPTADAAIAAGRERMRRALEVEDHTERMLLVVDAVQAALADRSLRPVVVGGLAVEYYTHAYATADIDVLLPSTPMVEGRLAALGFERHGRIWSHDAGRVVWEMPGNAVGPLDVAVPVGIPGGGTLLMLRCEDILVHRIEEFVGLGHADVYEQALALLLDPALDLKALRARAASVGQTKALEALQADAEAAAAGRDVPPTWELHALAARLRDVWRRTFDPEP